MTTKKPSAKVISKDRVFDGFFKLDAYKIEFEKHDGGFETVDRLIFERGHAVGILAYDPVKDQVVLVNEMRPGIAATGENAFSDALPAGMIDRGETALKAAERELQEETGLTLKDMVLVHPGAYVSPGGTSEKIALVLAVVDSTKAGGVHGKATESENIKTEVLPSSEYIDRANKGDLVDLKTLTMAFWLAINKDSLQKKYTPLSTGSAPKN